MIVVIYDNLNFITMDIVIKKGFQMGRKKAFDEHTALQQILFVFWEHGYGATTYSLLEKETGVAGKSLVNTFGDKDKLFLKIFEMYHQKAEDKIDQLLTPPSRKGIIQFFETLDQPGVNSPNNYGCMVVNTIFELEKVSPAVKQAINDFGELWKNTFKRGLELDKISDPEAKSNFLLGMFWGILSHIRLLGTAKAGSSMIQVTSETIQSWKCE